MREQLLIMFAVIGGAAVVPFWARKFRIPSAALEILYGIALFNTLISAHPEWFDLLKELGLIFLMFIAGMELDIRKLVKGRRFYWYIVIPLLSLLVTPLLFYSLGFPFYLGIAASVISAGIIIPVLKEFEILETDFGRDAIGIALMGELLSILVLMAIDVHHRFGFTFRAGLEGAKLIVLTALAALFLRILYIIAWWNPQKVEKVMESDDPVEEGIRAVIFIAITGALVAFSSGLEPILGSFLAGLVFSYVFKSKGRFEDKINAVGFGFFTPFFFIGVGADFDISLLQSLSSIYLSLFLTLMVLGSNLFPLLFSHFMKITFLEAFGMCLILSAPLSLMVVAGTIGVTMELISEKVRDSITLTAIAASILYPFLFRLTGKKITSPPPQKS